MTLVFEHNLENLKKQLVAMGGLVEDIVQASLAALADRRAELAEEVRRQDKAVDAMENAIDEACLKLLAMHQPVANDLRFIVMAQHVSHELERIGDHAKNIARASNELSRHRPLPVSADLAATADIACEMLHGSLTSLVRQDGGQARSVRARDRDLDERCDRIMARLTGYMEDDPVHVAPGIQVLLVVRNLERIGDLAGNIAKDLLFIVEGRMVRHGGATVVDDGLYGTDAERRR